MAATTARRLPRQTARRGGGPPVAPRNIFLRMKSEAERLGTFSNQEIPWPLSYMDPRDMARAGFFFTFQEDKVQCAFCRGQISTWLPGDDPLQEHKLHFMKNCPFLNGVNVGNEPIGSDPCLGGRLLPHTRSIHLSNSQGSDEVSSTGSSPPTSSPSSSPPSNGYSQDSISIDDYFGSGTESQESNVSIEPEPYEPASTEHGLLLASGLAAHGPPQHPAYTSISARIGSFVNWPKATVVTPEELAEAGFYYTGNRDCVQCFQCSGGLCDWNQGDVPVAEHIKYFPQCSYAILNHQPDDNQVCSQESAISSEGYHSANDESPQSSSSQSSSSSDSSDDEAELTVRMNADSTIVQTSPTASNNPEIIPESEQASEEMPSASNVAEASPETQHTDQPKQQPQSAPAPAQPTDIRCRVCLDRTMCVLYMPCKHIATCEQCGPSLMDCPICRERIQGIIKVFIS